MEQNLEREHRLRFAGVIKESIVDGPGIRYTVFAQGCPHHCKGCHNEETHDFQGGYEETAESLIKDIEKNPLLSGVTLSGGEPVCQPEALAYLAEEVKRRNLNVVMFTGYLFEDLLAMAEEDENLKRLLEAVDFLIDGPYVEEERDLTLRFRGSRNQRFIDLKRSLAEGKAVIIE